MSNVAAYQLLVVVEPGERRPYSVDPSDKLITTFGKMKQTALFQNYPNPFNPDTWIPYQLAKNAEVTIKIHDVTGKLIRTLNLGQKSSGSYLSKERAAYWDGKNQAGETVSSGVYFYHLQAVPSFQSTMKMVVVR